MTKTPDTFSNLEMPTIITNTGAESTKTGVEMNYLKNMNIDEAIHHKSRKKYLYETDMHKIYTLIVVDTNTQLKEKSE